MREILFRGKRYDNKEWVEGGYIPLDIDSGYTYIVEPYNHASTLSALDLIKLNSILVIPDTVGQYTGLTDKNGVKIFEGDIVMFNRKRNLPNCKCIPEVITYHQRDCAFQRYPYGQSITTGGSGKLIQKDMMSECEVIGNIHDNPELLKL